MSTLYRLLSAGRASTDGRDPAALSPPTTPRLSLSSSLPASPSLNDFSMGAAAEFEAAATAVSVPSPAAALSPRSSLDAGGGRALSGRFSFDSAAGGARTAADVRGMLWRNSLPAPSYGPPRTPAIPIPPVSPHSRRDSVDAGADPASPRVPPPATPPPAAAANAAAGKLGADRRRRARGTGKIDGLDYYEYVELIRASSL